MGRWKVGSFTAALGCIALGALVVLAQLDIVSYDLLGYLWPALLILFGVEMLLRLLLKSETKTRVSAWAIILIIVLVLASGGQSMLAGGSLAGILGRSHLVPVQGMVDNLNGITTVKVDLPNGKVKVTGVDSNTLDYKGELEIDGDSEVEAAGRLAEEWKVTAEGDTLTLEQKHDDSWLSDIHFGIYTKSPYLEITLPSSLAVEVETSDGTIEAWNLDAGLKADTSNGKLDIHDIAGGVEAHTSNGTMTVQNVQGEVELKSSNGAIELDNIDGPLEAKSSNGRITANSAVTGNWKLSSSNGKITVNLPAVADAQIEADTSNGSLKGNIGWDYDGDGKDNGKATLGSGTHEVKLSTSNGSITVDTAE
ncbi:DUF4097 family beta strand repeat-containing protein [Paenibacillus tengchongensis]|uniref:DUF4097 family beta strand repeat-containing protein n=1 Tax=Paenibacillus tengchongensis TaxID=2608684 RepID=UPI001652A948|nr:DUF4097 family beta strand repeat-containing protein [Paenibacillus tengchongensis]